MLFLFEIAFFLVFFYWYLIFMYKFVKTKNQIKIL